MSSAPKEKLPLEEIARSLESIRVPGQPGTFGGHRFDDLRTVFLTSIAWNDSIPDLERERIASQSIFAAANAGKLTKESLLKALHKLEGQYLAEPNREYIVLASLSARHFKGLAPITVENVRFSFYPRIPKRFKRESIYGFGTSLPNEPDGYLYVCARLSAKSAYGAHLQAETALELLRAVWNFEFNRRTISRITIGGSGKWEVLNKIRRGPIETVHHPDGSLATKEWWQLPTSAPEEPLNWASERQRVRKTTKWCLRLQRRIPYRDEAIAMWHRYGRAFDDPDPEGCLLKLWSLLELVTGTKGANYEEMIRRALFVCEDREFHHLILQHLRDKRNTLVHSDYAGPGVQECIFQLKGYVEEFLRLHLVLRGRFKSITEFGEFFSLPADPTILKERRRLYGLAFRFRERTLGG